MKTEEISVKTDDFDTLGGRLSRARDAINSPLAQVAELAGVDIETLEAWESDRAEPRSNRLTMLAGILGVSPSWLLFGRGASPKQDSTSAEIEAIEFQIHDLKVQYQRIGAAIESVENSLQLVKSEKSI